MELTPQGSILICGLEEATTPRITGFPLDALTSFRRELCKEQMKMPRRALAAYKDSLNLWKDADIATSQF
jgi:hypothetical protein